MRNLFLDEEEKIIPSLSCMRKSSFLLLSKDNTYSSLRKNRKFLFPFSKVRITLILPLKKEKIKFSQNPNGKLTSLTVLDDF